MRAEDLAETVDTAFNGHVASQVLEEQRTYNMLVRHDDASRESFDTIQSAALLSYQRHVALALCHVQGENAIVIVRRRFHYSTMIAAHRKVFTKKASGAGISVRVARYSPAALNTSVELGLGGKVQLARAAAD